MEDIGHKTPKYGYYKEVEYTEPDVKTVLNPIRSRIAFEFKCEKDQV